MDLNPDDVILAACIDRAIHAAKMGAATIMREAAEADEPASTISLGFMMVECATDFDEILDDGGFTPGADAVAGMALLSRIAGAAILAHAAIECRRIRESN